MAPNQSSTLLLVRFFKAIGDEIGHLNIFWELHDESSMIFDKAPLSIAAIHFC